MSRGKGVRDISNDIYDCRLERSVFRFWAYTLEKLLLEQLVGKDVVVHLGVLSSLTDSVKGKVVAASDHWIQLQHKRQMELIPLSAVKRIIFAGYGFARRRDRKHKQVSGTI